MSVYDADFPFGNFRRSIDTLREQIDGFSDDALNAFIQKAEGAVSSDRTASALWRNVADMARRRLALVEARRSAQGIWMAKAEATTSVLGMPDPSSRRVLEFRECDGKDAAVIAARELFARHADSFDHMTGVRVSIMPEIEWKAERALD